MTPAGCELCERVAAEGDFFIAELDACRYELSTVERARLIEDVNRIAQALARVYQPVKMNYELLGNQVAHTHWHLIPRLAGDPEPRWPVWRVEHEAAPLPMDQVADRIESLRRALAAPR
ncbi:MAG TPA: HIT family protein [Methylomirabilota bacterium]|nr:HIT family protein [Methylomirabilota bacterium]